MGKKVLFETLWASANDGWARASRTYARVLELVGFKVELLSPIPLTSIPDVTVLREVGHLAVTASYQRDIYIFSMPLASAQLMGWRLDTLIKNKAPRVLYTMFERTKIEPETIEKLNALDGVWVPCKRNAEILAAGGCTNVKWIPFPYFADDPHLGLELPRKKPSLLWVGRWEPRKAPDNLIRAFLRAFKPGEATLTLKIGPAPWQHSPFPTPENVLDKELALEEVRTFGWNDVNVGDIRIVREKLSPAAMVDLHRQSNVYVSASRGEGIDLPAFSAKLAGRSVVTTDSGGPCDFLDEDDVLVPAKGLLPAHGYEKLWGSTAHFIDYDVKELALGMRTGAERALARTGPRQRRAPTAVASAGQLADWLGGMA